MTRRSVSTEAAPAAIGPYSQAVRAGGMLFVSGQIPLDPATGQVIDGGIEAQTRRSLENVRAIVEAAGASMGDVVKMTVYLQDMDQFAAMNGVYATFFDSTPPSRAAVEVARLPKDVGVEIDAIAVLGGNGDA